MRIILIGLSAFFSLSFFLCGAPQTATSNAFLGYFDPLICQKNNDSPIAKIDLIKKSDFFENIQEQIYLFSAKHSQSRMNSKLYYLWSYSQLYPKFDRSSDLKFTKHFVLPSNETGIYKINLTVFDSEGRCGSREYILGIPEVNSIESKKKTPKQAPTSLPKKGITV